MPHTINETHDPNLKSWVESANDPNTDFPIQNLPFVTYIRPTEQFNDGSMAIEAGVAVRIGDSLACVSGLAEEGLFEGAADLEDLDDYFADGQLIEGLYNAPPRILSALRLQLSRFLRAGDAKSKGPSSALKQHVFPVSDVELVHAPVPNYTDFYASIHHATNVGSMFRPDNPLLPNYKWIPIGYHGRASSINISGEPVRRPKGQLMADGAQAPVYAPCKLLDYELELGFFVGQGNQQGDTININDADDHIFGLCLVNDWSARDIQKWEYQPLGPFLAKSFATTISPFIVTLEALAPFRSPAFERPASDPKPLPHLLSERDQQQGALDITLEVHLASKQMRDRSMPPHLLSRGSFKHMYWTIAQMLTHHASNGCNMLPGDLLASGTVSGPSTDSRGCLLELTWGGNGPDGKPFPRKPIDLPTGEKRVFLEDGDEVIIKGYCERQGFRRIGFGECRAIIEPAT
ncbi:MAG: fumarylacetoacetase [Phycisphaerales bacterium]